MESLESGANLITSGLSAQEAFATTILYHRVMAVAPKTTASELQESKFLSGRMPLCSFTKLTMSRARSVPEKAPLGRSNAYTRRQRQRPVAGGFANAPHRGKCRLHALGHDSHAHGHEKH